MAIGAGGTKPNISTFGADQFDDFDAREREVKASFFNWWMFSSFTGGLVAVLVLVFVQENVGWGVGAALRSDTRRLLPCTVTEVEEVKLIIGMIVVWLSTLVPCTIWAQVNTLFVKQGTTLDRSMGGVHIPAASLGSFITISMLLSIPVYDRVLVPLVRRRTGNPRGITLLQRLGIGCAFQVLVVACAYLVEVRRMRVIRERSVHHAGDTVPMSIFWMLPHGLGVGNFLNSLLVTLVDRATRGRESAGKSWIGDNLNDSHLDYYYVFLLLLSVLNMAVFVWLVMRYKYKREFLEVEHPESEIAGGQESGKLTEVPLTTNGAQPPV
ncbi:unnamed protein product [Miscanthus lutarioriparius]|uniref:Uncharacterized protein n=1 Tax=Miscanthus lutarioriparius TaxID=422564 RepID=A0A811S055_9POAL|nr:unnamed protein product [Miscanthus lutarioriparius]